jgi:Flp pilus assembly protein TadG
MQFFRDRRGNIGIMAAVLSIPLLVSMGLAIDYAMMLRSKTILQAALDSGLLAAGQANGTLSQKEAIARRYVEAQAERLYLTDLNVQIVASGSGKGLVGSASGSYQSMMPPRLVSDTFKIAVNAEVKVGSDIYLDVAMVLDNTASLGDEGMQAVKESAQLFRTEIFGAAADPSRLQLAVVPFAGAVNVGRDFDRRFMDENADARWHARAVEGRWVAQINDGCVQTWDPVPSPGTGEVETFLLAPDWMRSIGSSVDYALGEVLGVKSAQSQAIGEAQEYGLPDGYAVDTDSRTGCKFVRTPFKISNFDLFDQISNVRWGGCVEARTDKRSNGTVVDFDTLDTLPTKTDADTLFVPFFWPDEADDGRIGSYPFVNNFMADVGESLPWTPSSWARMLSWGYGQIPTKYDGRPAQISSTDEYTLGPNRGCPEPLLPLSKDSELIGQKIDSLLLTQGGGTVLSEGVSWGWRVLSPTQPFDQASTNPNTRRVMVVMTDGENQLSRNPQGGTAYLDGPTISDYNAYGYLRDGRLRTTFEQAEEDLDAKTLSACAGARNAGIEIYTVLFRSTNSRAIANLKACAGVDDHFYTADDAAALNGVFAGIASSIGRYRLVK